ncbi:hypothetical protein A3K73_03800 [Candidatus Pacearchaeota archaeon RBG_13_36_9]|nr:MAG: hypothetical protein A3K73_03800 [Candidatus Pacearchaeota archaeon RBG_13_36_9]
MQTNQIGSTQLNNFLEGKQKEILAMAHKNTEEIVKAELALADFELLLSVNLSEEESKKLTQKAGLLREKSWQELYKKCDGDSEKVQEFLNKS